MTNHIANGRDKQGVLVKPSARSVAVNFGGVPHVIEFWAEADDPPEGDGATLLNEEGGPGAFRIVAVEPDALA